MSEDIIRLESRAEGALSSRDLKLRVNLIRELLKELMKEGSHYGTIPGCPKPSLWKPGAELIATAFQIPIKSTEVEDLSTFDEKRYRVTCSALNKDGDIIGSAVGVCSSSEEKYRWRKPVCDQEWETAPLERRREKWKKDGTTIKQVRTEPSDLDNTILQMADKRAYVAVVRKVTAASDVFTQDIEDLEPIYMGDEAQAPALKKPKPKSSALAKHEFLSMKSKYAGTCKGCDGPTKVGDDILYSKQLGVYHPECVNQKKEENTEAIQASILSNLEKMAKAADVSLLDRIGLDGYDSISQITQDYAQSLLEEFANKMDEEK